MNCHAHSLRPRTHGQSARRGRIARGTRQRRSGTSVRLKEALYDLVDMTARERFEARKPRF
ncbi:MAG: hypothetical protein ACE5FC_04700 [Myxococcota bacterium]